MEISEFMIGKAGEHLVVSDLILKNKNSFLAGEGLPYDVVCESDGKLIKIQVKTCIAPRQNKELYIYSLQNGKSKNRKQYQKNEISKITKEKALSFIICNTSSPFGAWKT